MKTLWKEVLKGNTFLFDIIAKNDPFYKQKVLFPQRIFIIYYNRKKCSFHKRAAVKDSAYPGFVQTEKTGEIPFDFIERRM